jgi:hypothetical protein
MKTMKNLLILMVTAFLGFSYSAQAQSCDTLRNWNPSDPLSLISGQTGYVPGHEVLGTDQILRWAEPFTATSTEVRAFRFVPDNISDAGGSITLTVRANNAGTPGAILASEVVTIASLNAGFYNTIEFTTPLTVNGNYFACIEVEYSNYPANEVAIISQEVTTGTLKMFTSNLGWEDVNSVYTLNGNPAQLSTVLDVLTSTAPDPIADFTFSDEVCIGGSFSVDASLTQNADQYEWFLSTNPFDINFIYDDATGQNATLTPTVSGGSQAIFLLASGGCRTADVGYIATVNSAVDATVTTTDASCGNNNGQIDITNATGGDGFYAYSITGGTNPQTSGNFTGLASGTYNVVITTAGDGCEYTETVTISNTTGETISVGADQTICEGTAATLSASGNGTIEWFNGTTSVGNGTSVSLSPTTTTTYDAVLTDASGCTDVAQVTVNVTPSNDATFSYVSGTLCLGGGNELPTINGTGTFTVTPTTGLVFADNSTGEIDIASSSAGTYDITFTTTGTCGESHTETITLTNAPDASFSYSANEFCAGTGTASPAFVPSSSAGNFTATPTGLSLNSSNGVITLGTSSAGTYTVVNTIAASGSCSSASASETITINALPVVEAGTDQEVCEGASVTLTATGADSYTWDNGVNQGSPFTPNPGTITYTVTGADATTGCENTDDVVVTVNPLPAVVAGADETLCDYNDPITLSGSPAGGTFSGTGLSGNDFDPSIGIGSYTITYTYTDGNGCEASDDLVITVDGCVSIDENDINEGLTIMPNPATDFIDIVMEGSNTIQSIQLVSAEGRVIKVNMSSTTENTTRIDVSSAAKGTYFIQVNTFKGQITKKVILQ